MEMWSDEAYGMHDYTIYDKIVHRMVPPPPLPCHDATENYNTARHVTALFDGKIDTQVLIADWPAISTKVKANKRASRFESVREYRDKRIAARRNFFSRDLDARLRSG
jgi:hypothetical protein